jgi:C4-dicarboxylate transporter DctM subunit
MGVPIAIVLAASSLAFILLRTDLPLVLIPQRMFVGTDKFILMSLPFFILAGLLMNEGGITHRLVRLSQFLVGNLRGGLAQVNVVTSMFFGGITGAAVADTSAVGTVLIPAMEEDGYSSEFAGAVTASSSIIGPIIPPSIPMLVYSLISDTSVGALFLAGAIPGILIGFAMMILNHFLVVRGGRYRPKEKERLHRSFQYIFATLKDGILALIMPFIIVGGIVGGVFTPTEASVVAVIYAFVLGFFIFRRIKLSRLPVIFLLSALSSNLQVRSSFSYPSSFQWLKLWASTQST